MKNVSITLTEKNFKLLVKHAFLGNWVLNATKTARDKEVDDFLDTILSIAKNYNAFDGIEYYEHGNEYAFTPEKEEELLRDMEDYDEDSFWENLIDKLSQRDAIRKHGIDKLNDMSPEDRMNAIWAEEGKYSDEFEKNGIDNLRIRK